jgi:RHS repeat-associated protein
MSATAETGMLEDRYEYDAFGQPYQGDLTKGQNLGYTGKPYDSATGMYNYGYRDYQPQAARFTTVDPIRDGNNWFAYVRNDPVNWIDPWGLSPTDKKPSFWETAKDVMGKIIAAPVTAIGLIAGTALVGIREWNADTLTKRYDWTSMVNIGKHEEAHTYQYQKYGILTPALIIGSAIINGGLKETNFHDFMGKSNFENAADNYAQGLIDRRDLL